MMNNMVNVVDDDLLDWDADPANPNRYSIFTQNLMLAEKVSKRQHLTPQTSKLKEEEDAKSFHSAESTVSPPNNFNGPTVLATDVVHSVSTHSNTTPANIGRPRTQGSNFRQGSKVSSGDWTWRPTVPQRVSSMNTRCRKGTGTARPDLATFHRRSCQLFSSLDSTLSNATSTATDTTDVSDTTDTSDQSRASTSPSLAASITTQATSILDDHPYIAPAFPSFYVELDNSFSAHGRENPFPHFQNPFDAVDHAPRLRSPRSSSQLCSEIVSTKQVFWTSDASRQVEYAKIDAAHSGFKGFMKRILPRKWGWAHGKRRNFYQQSTTAVIVSKVEVDTDSVRRYRISIASETREAIASAERDAKFRPATPLIEEHTAYVQNEQSHDVVTDNSKEKFTKTKQPIKVFSKVKSSEALAKMFRSGQKNSLVEKKAKRRSAQL